MKAPERPRHRARDEENRELDRVAGLAAAERLRACRAPSSPPAAPRPTEARELTAWVERRQSPVLLTADDDT